MVTNAALRLDIVEEYSSRADMFSGDATAMMTSVASSMMTSVASSMMTSVASSMMTSVASAAMTSVAQNKAALDLAGKIAGTQTSMMTSVAGI
ncbi:hypothetical protein [Pseudotabrizicola sp. 4114]|uniref:hypothetical protein n=1 Tax=Pseudotabrizicola sp. 4114 TaxID=2817731 RepID=UPI002854B9E2|nr:hypothetical protein [Pseudorhodobacter sp. 4114]